MYEKRKPKTGTMIQTRMLLGSAAIAHSCAGAFLEQGVGISWLAQLWHLGWLLPALLGVFGATMLVAAIAEMLGYEHRTCRGLSAAFLATQWFIVWAYSWIGGADYTTFIAPVYIGFIAWAAIAEAHAARRLALYKAGQQQVGIPSCAHRSELSVN